MMKCAVMYMLSNGFNLFIPPCLDAQVAFLGRCYSVKIFTYTLLLKPLRIITCHHHNLFFLSLVYVDVSEFQIQLYFYGSVGGADYGSVRIGAFMGLKMIKSVACSMLSRSLPSANGVNLEELEDDGVELLEAEASLDYLCNLSPHRYELF